MHTVRVRRRDRGVWAGALASLGIALSLVSLGCGSGGAASTAAAPKPQPITFTSPAMVHRGTAGKIQTIPVRYTCDGSDTIPSFKWGPVPRNTAELTLFLFRVGRTVTVPGGGARVQATIEWAVSGLSPKIHTITVGKLPHGAVAVSKRYSICPTKGKPGQYVFQLNALSHRLLVKAPSSANRLFQAAQGATVASGSFIMNYKRV